MDLRRRTILLTFALLTAAGGPARADEDRSDRHDHDRARWAREQGHARPLAEILDQVRDQLGGEVVGVEFDRDGSRYVYEFKVITSAGRLREVYVDAMTAEIMKSEDD